MNYRAMVILLAAGWTTGCTVGPNYHRPAVQTPQAFRAPDPLPAPQAESFADLKWWEVLRIRIYNSWSGQLSSRITTCGKRSPEWKRRGPIWGSRGPTNSHNWGPPEPYR